MVEVHQGVGGVPLRGEGEGVGAPGEEEGEEGLGVGEEDGATHEVEVLGGDRGEGDAVVDQEGDREEHQDKGLEAVHTVAMNLETERFGVRRRLKKKKKGRGLRKL